MSRKDYVMIARVLAVMGADEALVKEMALTFEADNPRFDLERFMSAALHHQEAA